MKIYIPEPIPSGNKGEEAILQGIYQGFINQSVHPEITVFSYDVETDRKNYAEQFKVIGGETFRPRPNMPKLKRSLALLLIWTKHFLFVLMYRCLAEKAYFFFRKPTWRAYGEADLILVGHDGFISDINLALAIFTKALGKPSAIFGGGFKGFRLKITERFASKVLNLTNVVILREKHCYDYLKSLKVPDKKLFFQPDPAFVMEPAEDKEIDALIKKEGLTSYKSPLIGMIVLVDTLDYKYFYGTSLTSEQRFKKHMEFCAQMTDRIIETTGGTVVFMPHAMKTEFGSDDRYCAREVKKLSSHSQSIVLIEDNYSARELKGLITRLDFLVSQRLHAVIAAASAATPFIMVSVKEDYRAHDILEHTIGEPDLAYNLNTPTIDGFLSRFKNILQEREIIKNRLAVQAGRIHTKCNEGFEILLKRVTTQPLNKP